MAERVIHTVCRALPEAEREDRELEWAAEAEAVATAPESRLRLVRAAATLRFAVSLLFHIRALRRAHGPASRRTERGLAERFRFAAAIHRAAGVNTEGAQSAAGFVYLFRGIDFFIQRRAGRADRERL
ncbi:hypothetical protein [Streptomyces mirabilis]|uniref:hypothetical protein n=1 Tax=Streptomyces mirabilis TaxID=68239 RepID=UPI00224EDC0F|nr:hypothetical protein [Streptomyces mirabilis]MCX4429748.1 hypothetical protein [Streptomyces mirabilis]